MIEIRNLSLWYERGVQVLYGIDAALKRGQRLVICGSSGSGKSTLLRCINGLEHFQEGEIRVDGVLCAVAANGYSSPSGGHWDGFSAF